MNAVKRALPYAILVAANLSVGAPVADPIDLEDETDLINYILGYQVGGDFRRQGIEIKTEAMIQGINDAVTGTEPRLSAAEMQTRLAEFRRKLAAERRSQNAERRRELLAEGEAFLEQNASKAGVFTTRSGLQYRVIEEGTGPSPTPTDRVTVHYTGTLIDGSEFDSSHKRGRPATFGLNAVIKGWTEGLQLMRAGGRAQLFIPPDLAYGDKGRLAHQTLVFDVELIAVGEQPPAAGGTSTAR